MIEWPHCYGPLGKQYNTTGAHGGENSKYHETRSKEVKETGRGRDQDPTFTSEGSPPMPLGLHTRPCLLNLAPSPNNVNLGQSFQHKDFWGTLTAHYSVMGCLAREGTLTN